ncbi:MAG: 3'-5' exonuclease [Bdellovibrionota bacterium]
MGFLDQVLIDFDLDKLDPDTPMLTMMTVHNSKGLEYPNIFVVGMEEGVFPHQRSLDDADPNEIEEERRLCYVAMTRAEKKLHLTACQQRRHFRNVMFNPVSRFIGEIPESMLNVIPNYNLEERKPKQKFRDYDDRNHRDEYRGKVMTTFHPDANPQSFLRQTGDQNALPRLVQIVAHPDFGQARFKKLKALQTI